LILGLPMAGQERKQVLTDAKVRQQYVADHQRVQREQTISLGAQTSQPDWYSQKSKCAVCGGRAVN
jgi:hypothetical protein